MGEGVRKTGEGNRIGDVKNSSEETVTIAGCRLLEEKSFRSGIHRNIAKKEKRSKIEELSM